MKKRFSLLLIALLIVCSFGPMAYATDDYTYGETLQAYGIIGGDANGNLNGNKALTRGELVAIINTLTTPSNDTFKAPIKASFSDVPTKHWAYKLVERAKANDVTQGIGNGLFGINDKVTYKQAQAFMLNMLGYQVAWNEVEDYAEYLGIYCEEAVNATSFTRDMMFEILWHSLMAPAGNEYIFIENVMEYGNLGLESSDLINLYIFNSMFTNTNIEEGDYVVEQEPFLDMSLYNLDAQVPIYTEEDQTALGYADANNYLYLYDGVAFKAATYADYMNTIVETLGVDTYDITLELYDDVTSTYNDFDLTSTKDGTITLSLTEPNANGVKFDKITLKQDSLWKSSTHPYDPALTGYILNLSHPQDSNITIQIVITFDKELGTWESTIFTTGI